MNYTEMNNMMMIASAPVVDVERPLPIRVTHAGRAVTVAVRFHTKRAEGPVCEACGSSLTDGPGCFLCDPTLLCPRCHQDLCFCECIETDALLDTLNLQAMQTIDTTLSPLSERLADSMKDDKRP